MVCSTLWFQLEDMFQLIGTPQGIEHVMFQLKDMPQGFKKYRVKYKEGRQMAPPDLRPDIWRPTFGVLDI